MVTCCALDSVDLRIPNDSKDERQSSVSGSEAFVWITTSDGLGQSKLRKVGDASAGAFIAEAMMTC